jgi:hypothetical protein
MQVTSRFQDRDRPENLVSRLIAQLSQHALWDSVLIYIPPALALIYIITSLSHAAWLSELTAILIIAVAIGCGLLAVMLRYRPLIPSVSSAARLVDQRAGAQDHFLTMATIEQGHCSASFMARLRHETASLGERVELKRDFPYKLKRSAFWSVGFSLFAVLLMHVLSPLVEPGTRSVPVYQRLRGLADQMAQKPGLNRLAQDLKALAATLEDPKMPREEKQTLAQEMEKKIVEQQKKEEEQENRDLLSQAASTMKGVEQSASGQDRQKDQQKGSGGIQSNLPQKGPGDSKQSQGGDGESKSDSSAQPSKDIQKGNSAEGNPKEPGQDKNQQAADAKGNQSDPKQPGNDQSKEKTGKSEGASKEGAGKNQASEEPPQGAPPAERFYKAGEGKEGIRGARYVTVQLPEEVAADAKGESRAAKESKGIRARPQVPVSNAPLPAHVPNAPTEKQQVPIEYRGIIR